MEYDIHRELWILKQKTDTFLGNGRDGIIQDLIREHKAHKKNTNDRLAQLDKRLIYGVVITCGTMFLDGRISDLKPLLALFLS